MTWREGPAEARIFVSVSNPQSALKASHSIQKLLPCAQIAEYDAASPTPRKEHSQGMIRCQCGQVILRPTQVYRLNGMAGSGKNTNRSFIQWNPGWKMLLISRVDTSNVHHHRPLVGQNSLENSLENYPTTSFPSATMYHTPSVKLVCMNKITTYN